jgi:hypothetical protein
VPRGPRPPRAHPPLLDIDAGRPLPDTGDAPGFLEFNSSALPGIGAASQPRDGHPVNQGGDARTQGEIEGDGVTSIDPSAWIAIVLVTSCPPVAVATTLVWTCDADEVTSTEYVPASRPWAESRQPWTIISLVPPDVGGAQCTVALWVDWLTTRRTRSACATGPEFRKQPDTPRATATAAVSSRRGCCWSTCCTNRNLLSTNPTTGIQAA